MVKIIDQDIPSEYLDAYKRSLRQSTNWKPGANIYTVRTRQPFRLPHMRSNNGNSPSGAQLEVRAAFKDCIECFNNSPKTGGATPPDEGYRSREWWFNEATGSGLWYYDYFISQTWAYFYGGITPVWCLPPPTYIECDVLTDSTLRKYGSAPGTTANIAWTNALSNYNSSSWEAGQFIDWDLAMFFNEVKYVPPYPWGASIMAFKAKFTIDLTEYDPDDYYYAYFVVKPVEILNGYYNGQGWIEDEYNFLLDVTAELGTIWTSPDHYALNFTPSQPPDGETTGYVAFSNRDTYPGYVKNHGFCIALYKKPD